VAEAAAGRVDRFSRGRISSSFTQVNGVRLKEPEGLAMDSRGDLFIADAGASSLYKLSPGGKIAAAWRDFGKYGALKHPAGLATNRTGVILVPRLG
jgi:hypothetical protein